MELSVYSALTLGLRTYLNSGAAGGTDLSDGDKIAVLGFFHAWDMSTILPILSNCASFQAATP